MGRGPAEEAVVIVKPDAEDPVETPGRTKHQASARDGGGEGWNTEAESEAY